MGLDMTEFKLLFRGPRRRGAKSPPEAPLPADLAAARRTLEATPRQLAATLIGNDLGDLGEDSVWEGPGENGSESGHPASDGVRLIATQMAIAGSTRDEIQSRLIDQFGIEDARPVLGEIFGENPAGRS